MRLQVLVFTLILCFSSGASAFFDDGLIIKGVAMNFDFSEYDESGEILNENGLIGGMDLKLGKALGPVWLALEGSFLKGEVDYTGKKQSKDPATNEDIIKPHTTVTDETIYDFSFQVGRIYESWRRHDFSIIYAGMGFHQWVRDIKTKSNVVGLYERYTWIYALLGARGFLFRTERAYLMIDMTLIQTIQPIMDVSFKGNFDEQRVNLTEHYGAKLAIPFRYEVNRRFQIYSEIFFQAWDLGRSEKIDLTAEGEVISGLQLVEPRSSSRFYGMTLGFFLTYN